MLEENNITLKARKLITRYSVKRLRLINTGEITREKQGTIKLATYIIKKNQQIINSYKN